jgi:CheY-like chemotaxis protein
MASHDERVGVSMTVTVLIVDDSKLARIVAGKALAELQPDWKKIEAGSAADALVLIDAQPVDIALIDFNMVEKDGLQLAAELRALRPDLPIAIITANIQDEVIARARAIGATFVPKPVTADGLQGFLSGAALRLRSAKG